MAARTGEGWTDVVSIAAIADAPGRARAAHDALQSLDARRADVLRLRYDAVRELREEGWTWSSIAALLGIHRNRAAHLLDRRLAATDAGDGRTSGLSAL